MDEVTVPGWLLGSAALWVYSAAVQALPDPDEASGKLYRFLFQFAHALAANTNLVKRTSERATEDNKNALLRQ